MSRIASCCAVFVFLLIFGGVSWAGTYKCTRPDGSVFYSNDPSQVPKGCVIERIDQLPPIGAFPDPQPAVPDPGRAARQPPQPETENAFAAYARETELLFEQFQDARQRAVRSTLVADKLAARRELADIRARAGVLRNEISQAPLSAQEKQTLEDKLTAITE